jgi:hypothetical protein
MKNETLARISTADAKRFLTELANLRDDAVERFQKGFGALVPNNIVARFYLGKDSFKRFTEEEEKKATEDRILELRNLVRKVWIQPDMRTKRYGVFLLWKWSMFTLTWVEQEIPDGLPPYSPFEKAILLLSDAAEFARYCGNPECFTPYFFASRRNQKYCSDACAKPAQREFKRQWWAEHGEKWRATRKPKKSNRSPQPKTKEGKRSKKSVR